MEMSRLEMQELLAKFCIDNPEYRAALIRNPREVVKAQFKMELPDDLEVKVVEEGPKTVYFIVPHSVESGAELSDDDLESVAGGAKVKGDANCDDAVLSTVIEINASLF